MQSSRRGHSGVGWAAGTAQSPISIISSTETELRDDATNTVPATVGANSAGTEQIEIDSTVDSECLICRMEWSDSTVPQSLRCGHVLCTACRSRIQTCPFCRADMDGRPQSTSTDSPHILEWRLSRMTRQIQSRPRGLPRDAFAHEQTRLIQRIQAANPEEEAEIDRAIQDLRQEMLARYQREQEQVTQLEPMLQEFNNLIQPLGWPTVPRLDATATLQQNINYLAARMMDVGSEDLRQAETMDTLRQRLDGFRTRGNEPHIRNQYVPPVVITSNTVRIENQEYAREPRPTESQCNICAEPWNGVSRVSTRLPCGHSLCSTCVARIVDGTNACPFCRRTIVGVREAGFTAGRR